MIDCWVNVIRRRCSSWCGEYMLRRKILKFKTTSLVCLNPPLHATNNDKKPRMAWCKNLEMTESGKSDVSASPGRCQANDLLT